MFPSAPSRLLIAVGAELPPDRCALLVESLRHRGSVEVFHTGSDALEALLRDPPSLVLVGLTQPDGRGVDLCRRIASRGRRLFPLVVIGAPDDPRVAIVRSTCRIDDLLPSHLPIGGMLTRIGRILDRSRELGWGGLPETARAALVEARQLTAGFAKLMTGGGPLPAEEADRSARAIAAALDRGELSTLLSELRGHHEPSFAHSAQVATTLGLLGGALGLDQVARSRLTQAGLFHDLGKLAIPIATLNKPMALDDAEWHTMRRHPELGARVLGEAGAPEELRLAALGHHERPDGTGYPFGLKRGKIDEISLLCAICDVHAALTEPRAYRSPVDDEAALRDMAASGQFEPRLLALFRTVLLDHLAPLRQAPNAARDPGITAAHADLEEPA